jgi:hypothetical protein
MEVIVRTHKLGAISEKPLKKLLEVMGSVTTYPEPTEAQRPVLLVTPRH